MARPDYSLADYRLT